MDLKGLPQTVQNFIEETIQNRENGKFPDNETCQKVMEYAADTGSQKLAGLGLGADDYIMKPFDSKELVARVKAVLRRYQAVPKPEVPAVDKGKCVEYP